MSDLVERIDDIMYRHLVQSVTDYAIYMISAEGFIINWNAGAERAKGYTSGEIVGRHFSCFYGEDDQAAGRPQHGLDTARAFGRFEAEGWRLRKDGVRFWAHVVIDAIYDDDGGFVGFAKITRDCTEKRAAALKLEQALANLDLTLSNISQGICLIDADKRIVLGNEQLRKLFRIAPTAMMPGLNLPGIIRDVIGDDAVRSFEALHFVPFTGNIDPISSELVGTDFALLATTRALPEGGWVSTFVDVTQRRKIEQTALFLAGHDVLTQLPNRKTFHEELEQRVSRVDASNIAVLYLDLDRFKSVNDSYGHLVGDAVLKGVALRLERMVGQQNLVARLGGDEFAIILHLTEADQAVVVADRIVQMLADPFAIHGLSITIGCSVGVAVRTTMDTDANTLLQNADFALYHAKHGGRNRSCIYDAGLRAAAAYRLCLESDLRRAVTDGAFELHYQPIVRASTGRIIGYEALLRWNRNGRAISPAEFIPIAEEMGLMPALGAWVLTVACHEAMHWPASIILSVNLSPTQLRHDNLVEIVKATLAETGLSPSRLEFEITETAILADKTLALHTLQRLRAMGVAVALDDFGTGYSSLSFVHDMPITRIKIDHSFIRGLGEDTQSAAIVRAIIGLGRNLGLAVTAEGVETALQRELLVKARCSDLQGYLFGAPMPAEFLNQVGPRITNRDRGSTSIGA